MRKLSSTALIAAAALCAACNNTIIDSDPGDVPLEPWARSYSGNLTPAAISSGPDGDIFLGGTFTGSADFGAGALPAEPNGSLFMAHLDAAGGHLFSASTGSQDNIAATAIGPEGDLFVTGHFDGEINFGKGKINGTSEGFLATFKKDGASDYALTMDGSASVYVDDVAALPSGDIVMVARGDDTTDYGAGVPQGAIGQTETALVSYRRGGTYRWSVRIPASSGFGSGIAVDGDGNIYYAGLAYGPITIGDQSIEYGAFLLKLTPDGKPVWLVPAAGKDGNFPYAHDVSVDGDGNVYFCGIDYGGFSFGGIDMPPIQQQRAFVIKADKDGKGLYGKSLVTDGYGQLVRCKGTPEGELVAGITYYGSVDFGAGPVGTGTGYDTALARYDSGGALVKVMRLDGSGSEFIYDMAIDREGMPVITGTFDSVLDFGKTRLIADTGSNRMFVARVDL